MRFSLGQNEELRGSEGEELDVASGEAALKVLQGLIRAADLSSTDGTEPARAKATKGQVTARER